MNKRLIILCAALCGQAEAGIVADTLFAECRGESKAGQIAVASVIWNRAGGKQSRLESVCLAPKQFSCWNNGYAKAKPRNERERAILAEFEALEKIMESGTFKPSGNYTHYHTLSVKPSWSKSMRNVRIIGNHKFGVTK